MLDTPLWKLPRVAAQALAPKNLIFVVQQDDPDVGPEPFTVEHNWPQNIELIQLLHSLSAINNSSNWLIFFCETTALSIGLFCPFFASGTHESKPIFYFYTQRSTC